jgi:GTP pyrophosphokinase
MYEYARDGCSHSEQVESEAHQTITGFGELSASRTAGQFDAIALSMKQALAEADLKVKVWGGKASLFYLEKKI